MPKWMHIDTSGLPDHFDCVNLIEEGLTKKQMLVWMQERMKPGPPPPHVKPVANTKPKKVPEKQSTPVAPEPVSQGNVTSLIKPDPEVFEGLPPEFTEDALALKFTTQFKDVLLYVGAWEKWMVWDGRQWKRDATHIAIDKARSIVREACRQLDDHPELGQEKRQRMQRGLSTYNTMANIERIAKTDRRHVGLPSAFDSNPWTLNTPDGLIDLKTGEMRPARRDDFVSKITAVGPGGKCPLWHNFLDKVTQGDNELKGYLQRVAGYCLTGSIAEHAFFFAYGTGGNGKGTYKEMLRWMLNSYAATANIDTFTEHRYRAHSSEIAYFQGARLVISDETSEGSRWAENRIKAYTGGDSITAAFKHQNEFTFAPLFKLLFTGNYKPQLRSVDEAIKRRLYLIPFEYQVTKEEKDLDLPEKLRQPDEARGILSWMLEGCLEWQRGMLRPPRAVLAHTADYLESEDRIGRFLAEHTTTDSTQRVKTALLFARYKTWAGVANEYAVSRVRFRNLLLQKGFKSEKRGGEQVIIGLSSKSDWTD